MLGPYEQLGIGISSGILIALTFGYWENVKSCLTAGTEWIFQQRRSWAENVLIGKGEFAFDPGEQERIVSVPGAGDTVTDRAFVRPESCAFCKAIRPDEVVIRRLGGRDGLNISYEVWGWRRRFDSDTQAV